MINEKWKIRRVFNMRFEYLEITDSTSEHLKRKVEKQEYDVVIADKQTSGRGRRGKVWISNEGSGLFSFLIKSDDDYDEKIPLFCGYILFKKLFEILPQKDLKFKWPNDIYFKNKKISGILVEKIGEFLIVGIGINVNNVDFGLYDNIATSIKIIIGKEIDKNILIEEFIQKFSVEITYIKRNWKEIIGFLNQNHTLNDKYIKNSKKEIYYVKKINLDGSILVKKEENEDYISIFSDEIEKIIDA